MEGMLAPKFKEKIVGFIDKEGGVTLEDCQKISRLAGDLIEVEEVIEPAYTMRKTVRVLEAHNGLSGIIANNIHVKGADLFCNQCPLEAGLFLAISHQEKPSPGSSTFTVSSWM